MDNLRIHHRHGGWASEQSVDRKGGNLEIGETPKSSKCPKFSGIHIFHIFS
jgi:hypothetical protein